MNFPLRDILTFASRNGPAMLFGGVLIGYVAPPLADAARPLLGGLPSSCSPSAPF
jgi:hypothetical protein